MNDAAIGILFVLFAVVAYLLGYTTGRYCNGDRKHDAGSKTANYSIPLQTVSAPSSNVRVNVRAVGNDVDPTTLLVIDPKSKNTTTTARKKKKP